VVINQNLYVMYLVKSWYGWWAPSVLQTCQVSTKFKRWPKIPCWFDTEWPIYDLCLTWCITLQVKAVVTTTSAINPVTKSHTACHHSTFLSQNTKKPSLLMKLHWVVKKPRLYLNCYQVMASVSLSVCLSVCLLVSQQQIIKIS